LSEIPSITWTFPVLPFASRAAVSALAVLAFLAFGAGLPRRSTGRSLSSSAGGDAVDVGGEAGRGAIVGSLGPGDDSAGFELPGPAWRRTGGRSVFSSGGFAGAAGFFAGVEPAACHCPSPIQPAGTGLAPCTVKSPCGVPVFSPS